MTTRIFFDVETDGLDGMPFAAAAVAYNDEWRELARETWRIPYSPTVEWVQENVLPAIKGMAITHASMAGMAESVMSFLDEFPAVELWAHVPNPVETGFFNRALQCGVIDSPFGRPYVLDVGSVLAANGFNPRSVNDYMGADVPVTGMADHNPMHDCIVTAAALRRLLGE